MAGNQLRCTEKKKIKSSESQKTGIDTPINATNIDRLSIQVLCLSAEMIPRVKPTTTAIKSAANVNWSVEGKRANISLRTSRLLFNDRPKSP